MRKLLVLGLLLVSGLGFAQERVNQKLPDFLESSNQFKETIGYEYHDYNGQWSEENNDKGYFFNYLEFKTYEYKAQMYYVLIIHELDGEYRYPHIKQDFYTWNSLRAYIFTRDEYLKLKAFGKGKSKFTEISVPDTNGRGMDDLRIAIANTFKETYYSSSATFKIRLENDKLVRFILPIKLKYSSLESMYGFDKKYFESNTSDFKELFNLN